MSSDDCGIQIARRNDESEARVRARCTAEDVQVRAVQRAECTGGKPRFAEHFPSNNRNDRDGGIHGDISDAIMRHILRELAAQRFHRELGSGGGDDNADFALRRR